MSHVTWKIVEDGTPLRVCKQYPRYAAANTAEPNTGKVIAANRRDRVATSVHVINGVNSSTVQKTISELPVASVNAPAT